MAPPKAVVRDTGCVRAYGLGLGVAGPTSVPTRAQIQLQMHSRALAEENRRLHELLDEAIGLVGGAAEDFARREEELESELRVALAAVAQHRCSRFGSGPDLDPDLDLDLDLDSDLDLDLDLGQSGNGDGDWNGDGDGSGGGKGA